MRLSDSGFTLIELVITIAITVIVSALLVGIFTQNNNLFYNQQAKVNNGMSSNFILHQIDNAVRQAISVENQYPLQDPIYLTNSSTLILKLAAIDQNGAPLSNSFDYLVFTPDLSNSKIFRQLLFPSVNSSRSSVNQVLTTNLATSQFLYLNDAKTPISPTNATVINYSITVVSSQVNPPIESSSSGQTRLRNN